MHSLKDKVILITGAGSGVGYALAKLCARKGMRLAICNRDIDRIENVRDELIKLGAPAVYACAFPLQEDVAIAQFVKDVVAELGDIDILVNNAGLNSSRESVESISLSAWDEMMNVNVRAPLVLLQQVVPRMKERWSGHIVNVLSTVCLYASENIGAYTASKHAMRGLSSVLRKELRPFNITVTDILPGGIDTNFRPKSRPEYMSAESVAEAIIHVLTAPRNTCYHEVVMRPPIETNMP